MSTLFKPCKASRPYCGLGLLSLSRSHGTGPFRCYPGHSPYGTSDRLLRASPYLKGKHTHTPHGRGVHIVTLTMPPNLEPTGAPTYMLTEHTHLSHSGHPPFHLNAFGQHHCLLWSDIEYIRKRSNPVLKITTSAFKMFSRHMMTSVLYLCAPTLNYLIQITSSVLSTMSSNSRIITLVVTLSQLRLVQSAGGEDDLKSPVQAFDGVVSSFTPWLISFTAWIAWKKPQLSSIINGTSARPVPANADNPTSVERKRIKAWDLLNI